MGVNASSTFFIYVASAICVLPFGEIKINEKISWHMEPNINLVFFAKFNTYWVENLVCSLNILVWNVPLLGMSSMKQKIIYKAIIKTLNNSKSVMIAYSSLPEQEKHGAKTIVSLPSFKLHTIFSLWYTIN